MDFRISIPVALIVFSLIVSVCHGDHNPKVEDSEFISVRQDTVDSVRVHDTQVFYGQRGQRLLVRLRNEHVAEGLELKVAASSPDPVSFTNHHVIPEDEPNDDCTAAQLVLRTEMVNGYISSLNDEDFYQFRLQVVDSSVLVLRAGRGASAGNDDVDTVRMWLYDPTCAMQLAYAEDSLEAGVEIVHTFTDPGEHFYRVLISGTGNDTGNYSFYFRDTLFYSPPDTFPWNAETTVLPSVWNLRTNVIGDSASTHFLGIGDPDHLLDGSSEWRYPLCYNFDVDPWIITVSGSPPEIDTVFPDTFVIVTFTRAVISDTLGVSHFPETLPCTIWVTQQAGGGFIRGDADNNTEHTMADAIFTLKYMYVPGSEVPECMDAPDVDDSGVLSMADVIYLLKYMYVPGEPAPPSPCCDYPTDCGPDPTSDELGCDTHPCMGSRL